MADKKKKAPGVFKKPVKKTKWEKKYLRKIYLPEDRKFLESLAVEEDGMISLNVDGLSKKDEKRLKALGKTIKKNRKGVNFILIFIVVLLVGGVLFFNFYLKNRLVQRLIETQMEEIFEAQVDTKGVNLSIFQGELSLSYLAVADSQSPMRNLIEFSSVSADLRTAELLQGRVFIEELGFEGMKRGTERVSSGALVKDSDPEASGSDSEPSMVEGKVTEAIDSGKTAVDDVIAQLSALAGDFDVKEILEQQKENLVSFDAIDDSKAKVEQYSEHWQGRADDWKGRVGEWDSSIDYVKSVDADSFSSLDAARTTITELQSIYDDADRDYKAVQTDLADAESNIDEAAALKDTITAAIDEDYAYIESLVALPEGSKVDWAASILEEQLSMPITRYLSYLDRGLEWYNRFKRLTDAREEEKEDARRSSRSLPQPPDAPPVFTLVHAYASGEEPDLKYRFDLNNLVSEPEKWSGKTSLDALIDMPLTGAASASIAEDGLNLEVPAAPFDLGGNLSALDIADFNGTLAVGSDVDWDEGRFSGLVDLTASELNITEAKADSIIYRLVSTSLESVKPLAATGSFTYSEADGIDLKLDSELDESLGNAARALVSEGAEEGLEMLKEYLGEQLDGPLEEYNLSQDELEEYIDRIKNYEDEIDSYRQMADDKIAEIEQSVKDRAAAEVEQAIKDAVPDELEDKAQDAADTLKNSFGSKLKF